MMDTVSSSTAMVTSSSFRFFSVVVNSLAFTQNSMAASLDMVVISHTIVVSRSVATSSFLSPILTRKQSVMGRTLFAGTTFTAFDATSDSVAALTLISILYSLNCFYIWACLFQWACLAYVVVWLCRPTHLIVHLYVGHCLT